MHHRNLQSEPKSEGLEIAPSLFLFMIYMLIMWLGDIFDLVYYLLGFAQGGIATYLPAIIAIGGVVFLCRKKITIKPYKKDVWIWIITAFLLCFGVFKSIIADTSFDTLNYLILAQGPGYTDSFINNLAPGNFQLFGFLLPDRLFWPFRALLGYRMGTILNSIIMILVYIQVSNLLLELCGEQLVRIRSNSAGFINFIAIIFLRESFLAFLVVFTYQIVAQTALYTVEIISMPLILEAIRLLIKRNANRNQILYFSFLCGFCFAMKMTNIVYIVPIVIMFIIKNRSRLNIKIFITCAVLCTIPVCVYLLFNFSATGNPVFPYFNTIFKSPYFNDTNFKDLRWGPSSLKELVLWPFYMIIFPEYRFSEIANPWPYAFIFGIIYIFYIAIVWIRNKHVSLDDNSTSLVFFYVVSFYLWAATTGYERYFAFGQIVNLILAIMLLCSILSKKGMLRVSIAFFMVVILALQTCISFYKVAMGYEWSWRESTVSAIGSNSKHLLKDRNISLDYEIDMFLLIDDSSYGSLVSLIDSNASVYSYGYIDNHLPELSKEPYLGKIYDTLGSGAVVCDVWQYTAILPDIITRANDAKIKITELDTLDTYFEICNKLIVARFGLLEDGDINTYQEVYGGGLITSISNVASSTMEYKAIIGLNANHGWYSEPLEFKIEAYDTDGNSTILLEKEIEEGEFYNIDELLDLTGFTGNVELKYSIFTSAGDHLDGDFYKLYIINETIY